MAYNAFGAQPCGGGGLGVYAGGFQPVAPVAGLASYGQSLSSECIDFNSLNLGGYPGYGAPPTYPAYAVPTPYAPVYGQLGAYGAPAPYPPAVPAYNPYGVYSPYAPAYNTLDVNDPQLLQQVEQIVQSLNECKRPMLRRQVITIPANCPGRVACITRRLPTPPPDIIERITVIKPPRDIVNLCIEKPCQPGPCFQQREICGRPRKPLIQPRVIPVAPRSNPCAPPPPPPQPVCVPPPPPPCMPCQAPPPPVYIPPPQPQCMPCQAPPPPPPCMPCPPPPPPPPVFVPPPQPQCVPCPPPPPPCIPCPPPQPQCMPCPPPQPQCPPTYFGFGGQPYYGSGYAGY